MAAYLGYTLRMKTLFRGWPVMVHDMHTRGRMKWDTHRQHACTVACILYEISCYASTWIFVITPSISCSRIVTLFNAESRSFFSCPASVRIGSSCKNSGRILAIHWILWHKNNNKHISSMNTDHLTRWTRSMSNLPHTSFHRLRCDVQDN